MAALKMVQGRTCRGIEDTEEILVSLNQVTSECHQIIESRNILATQPHDVETVDYPETGVPFSHGGN